MTTARGWLDELTAYYTPSSTQFDGARSHRFAIEARLDTYVGLPGDHRHGGAGGRLAGGSRVGSGSTTVSSMRRAKNS